MDNILESGAKANFLLFFKLNSSGGYFCIVILVLAWTNVSMRIPYLAKLCGNRESL